MGEGADSRINSLRKKLEKESFKAEKLDVKYDTIVTSTLTEPWNFKRWRAGAFRSGSIKFRNVKGGKTDSNEQ